MSVGLYESISHEAEPIFFNISECRGNGKWNKIQIWLKSLSSR